ncbi:MAG: hypothetical protein ACYTBJ_21340 [Planctomycetota bacterium]|jgi:hypothetical protein
MTDDRNKWARIVAGKLDTVRQALSKKQDELDDAGIERKAIDLTPDIVDNLRNKLCEAFPAMCEGEGEVAGDVLQVILDALAEEQPESDIEEERVADEKQDEEEEEEKDSEAVALAQEVAELGKAYNHMVEDVSEVIKMMHDVVKDTQSEKKSYNDYDKRLAKIEKQFAARPRRASQAPETTLDPDSQLAKSMQERNLTDVPEAFKDMFAGEK